MKKKLALILTSMVFVFALTGCLGGNKENNGGNNGTNPGDNTEETAQTGVFAEQTVDGVTVSGIAFEVVDGQTTVYGVVSNKGEESIHVTNVTLAFQDKDGNVLGEPFFYVDKDLAAGDTELCEGGIDTDLSSATDVVITVVK